MTVAMGIPAASVFWELQKNAAIRCRGSFELSSELVQVKADNRRRNRMPAECDPDLVGYTVAKRCIDDEEYKGVIGLFENVFSIRYPIAKR